MRGWIVLAGEGPITPQALGAVDHRITRTRAPVPAVQGAEAADLAIS